VPSDIEYDLLVELGWVKKGFGDEATDEEGEAYEDMVDKLRAKYPRYKDDVGVGVVFDLKNQSLDLDGFLGLVDDLVREGEDLYEARMAAVRGKLTKVPRDKAAWSAAEEFRKIASPQRAAAAVGRLMLAIDRRWTRLPASYHALAANLVGGTVAASAATVNLMHEARAFTGREPAPLRDRSIWPLHHLLQALEHRLDHFYIGSNRHPELGFFETLTTLARQLDEQGVASRGLLRDEALVGDLAHQAMWSTASSVQGGGP
jgi:hypothetical protein